MYVCLFWWACIYNVQLPQEWTDIGGTGAWMDDSLCLNSFRCHHHDDWGCEWIHQSSFFLPLHSFTLHPSGKKKSHKKVGPVHWALVSTSSPSALHHYKLHPNFPPSFLFFFFFLQLSSFSFLLFIFPPPPPTKKRKFQYHHSHIDTLWYVSPLLRSCHGLDLYSMRIPSARHHTNTPIAGLKPRFFPINGLCGGRSCEGVDVGGRGPWLFFIKFSFLSPDMAIYLSLFTIERNARQAWPTGLKINFFPTLFFLSLLKT